MQFCKLKFTNYCLYSHSRTAASKSSLIFASALGYLAKTSAEAIKEVAVARENSKNDLNLKKRLVDVEINNFKTKKISAIQPMIDTFNSQVQKGKSKEELKAMAENILIEIKNGPPYVYN